MTRIQARYIYELERQLPNRNFAKDHGFEEWLEWVGIERASGLERCQ